MINKLRNYVEKLFEEAPKTKKVLDLKDELTANLFEKYNDLLVQGKSEDEAYNIVISGIGDVSELFTHLDGESSEKIKYNNELTKKSAGLTAVAVMMYILCIVPILLSNIVFNPQVAVVLMFVIAAFATGLIVYASQIKPKYLKSDETLVEEFKEWKSEKLRKSSARKAISSAFWTSIVAIYLVVSFLFGLWAFSWIIFIIGAAIEQIIKAIYEVRGEQYETGCNI